MRADADGEHLKFPMMETSAKGKLVKMYSIVRRIKGEMYNINIFSESDNEVLSQMVESSETSRSWAQEKVHGIYILYVFMPETITSVMRCAQR